MTWIESLKYTPHSSYENLLERRYAPRGSKHSNLFAIATGILVVVRGYICGNLGVSSVLRYTFRLPHLLVEPRHTRVML